MNEHAVENDALHEALLRLRVTSNINGYRAVVEAFGLCGHPTGHDGPCRTGTAGCAARITTPASTHDGSAS